MLDLVPISLTGFNKLMEELSQLEKEAVEVRKRVSEAREQGDLKENGEFIYGRQQLGFIEGRLGELRTKINLSEKIDCTKVQCDRAVFGTVVTLLDLTTQEKVTWQLLGPHDADIDTGSISIHSPVGDAVHGLSPGEKASGKTPRGEFHYEVIDIAQSQIQ
jgi:transcription elongation factor GreA